MNGANIENLRARAKRMVKPPITLSELAKSTGINISKLSLFIHKNLDISSEEADKIYRALADKNRQKATQLIAAQ